MATINIKGRVFYADGSPAQQVRVSIFELDRLPGERDDLILERTVDAHGFFAGKSGKWDDSPADIFPVLTFKAEHGIHQHSGPFITNGDVHVPIVLPPDFPKPVERSERELVQIVYLVDDELQGAERALYQFIENGSTGLVDSTLGDDYRRVHHLNGSRATLANLKSKLILAGTQAATKAVDLVFCTHGLTDGVVFRDGTKSTAQVLEVLVGTSQNPGIPQNIRDKFRMVFSTACYGSTHNRMWIDAGFACASGSEKVYADSEASLFPFLNSWASRNTFGESIDTANAADIGNAFDNVAKEYYRRIGKANKADDIESNRLTRGNREHRIYSKPR